jgi:hypothetical protein
LVNNDIPLKSYPSSQRASTDIKESGPDTDYGLSPLPLSLFCFLVSILVNLIHFSMYICIKIVCGADKPLSRQCYAIVDATIYPMVPTIEYVLIPYDGVCHGQSDSDCFFFLFLFPFSSHSTSISNGVIVVQNGTITCMGASGTCTIPQSCLQYTSPTGTAGVVIPGMVDIWSAIGTTDVLDRAGSPPNVGPGNSLYRAMDDIWVSPKHVRMAWAAGISTSVVPPQTNALVKGVSVAFHTCCGNVIDDQVISERVALSLHTGGASGSNSADINMLRQLFSAAKYVVIAFPVHYCDDDCY